MQIHELGRKPAKPVTGLDTTKVSPHIAAQIAKAKANSQAKLSQQAKQAVSSAGTAVPTTPYQIPGNNTNPNPTPTAQPYVTQPKDDPAYTQSLATARQNTQDTQDERNQAAKELKKVAPATGWARLGAIGKAVGTAAKHGIAGAAGIDPDTGKAVSSPSYQYRSQPGTAPAAGTPQATLMAKLAPTGLTQKGLAAAGQVLQQLGNGNKILKKTGDRNVDAVLSSMGYTLQ
jgi:hypothetical protein